jgi:hypothetical protein
MTSRCRGYHCGALSGIVECILDRLLHGLEHLLYKLEERLNTIFDHRRLMPEEVHDGLDDDDAVVFIFGIDQTHQFVHDSRRVRFKLFGRGHWEAVEDLEHRVSKFLSNTLDMKRRLWYLSILPAPAKY